MDAPSNDELRERSEILAKQFPAPNPPSSDAPSEKKLRILVQDDAPVLSEITGRSIGIAGTPGVEVPDYLKPTAIRALALRLERRATGWTAAARERAMKNANLRSISAGPWSESYFGPNELVGLKALDPDPLLHELLWALATPEKRAYWLALWDPGRPPAPFLRTRRISSVNAERAMRGW